MQKQFSLLLTVLTAAFLAAALPRPALAAQDAGSAPAPSQSQPQTQAQPQAEGPDAEAQDLDDQKLNLSPEQRKELQQIREDGRAQVQAVRNDPSLTPAQKKHRIRQIRKTMHQQVMGVLSPEQRKIWRTKQRERREHRRHHRRQPA